MRIHQATKQDFSRNYPPQALCVRLSFGIPKDSRTHKGLKGSFPTQLRTAPLKYKGIPAVAVLALRKNTCFKLPCGEIVLR